MLGEPGSNFPCHAACSSARELERGPYHLGQLLVVVYFWNLCQLLPPVRCIEHLPPGYPPFIFLCWGFWGGITSAIFPCTAGWLLQKALDIWSQLWWWPRSNSRKGGSAPSSSQASGLHQGGLCSGEWTGLSSGKALQCLLFCPRTFSFSSHNSEIGHGHLAGLW